MTKVSPRFAITYNQQISDARDKFFAEHPEAVGYDEFFNIGVTQMRIAETFEHCMNCEGSKTCKSHFGRGILGRLRIDHETRQIVLVTRPCDRLHKDWKISTMLKLQENAGIPDRFRQTRLKDFRGLNSISGKAIRDYVEGNSIGLWLSGNYGCGKTMLAAIIANSALRRGETVVFTTYADLLDDVKRGFADSSSTHGRDMIDAITVADHVIIDDLGAEAATPFAAETLFRIVNRRYAANRRIIITSNYAFNKMSLQLNSDNGKRVMTRLMRMCIEVRLEDHLND